MKTALFSALLFLLSSIKPLFGQTNYSIFMNDPSMEFSYQIDTVWGRPLSLTAESFSWENNTKSIESRKIVRFKNGKFSQYALYKKTTKEALQKPGAGKPQLNYITQMVLKDSLTSARVGQDSILYFPIVSNNFYPFLLCYKNNHIRELVGFYNSKYPTTSKFLSTKPAKRNQEVFDESGRLTSAVLYNINGGKISEQNLTYELGWRFPVLKKTDNENGCNQEVNELNEKGEVIKIKSLDCSGVLNHSGFINRSENSMFAGISYKEENLNLFDTLFIVNKIKSIDNKTLTEIIINHLYSNKISGFYEISEKLNIFNEGGGIKQTQQAEYHYSSRPFLQKNCKAQRIHYNDKNQVIKIEVFFGLPVDIINSGLGDRSPDYIASFNYDEKNNLLMALLEGNEKLVFSYDSFNNLISKKRYIAEGFEFVLKEELVQKIVYQR